MKTLEKIKKSKRLKVHESVGHYFSLGVSAVEARVEELNEAKELYSKAHGKLNLIRDCMNSIELGGITPKVKGLLRLLANRTLREIEIERAAFQAVLGSNLRVWEVA